MLERPLKPPWSCARGRPGRARHGVEQLSGVAFLLGPAQAALVIYGGCARLPCPYAALHGCIDGRVSSLNLDVSVSERAADRACTAQGTP